MEFRKTIPMILQAGQQMRYKHKEQNFELSGRRRWDYLRENSIETYTFSSLVQSCPTLCNPMDCSMPGLPVHHQLPELAQTHVHRVGDAIQLSHPL